MGSPTLNPVDRTSWPKVRLYTDTQLAQGQSIDLVGNQAHYIQSVMRIPDGGSLRLFNGCDGEWAAQVTHSSRKTLTVCLTELLRPQMASPPVSLIFSPIKKTGTDFIIQKATELGATRLYPVRTQNTESTRINLERFQTIAIEAAEQCERLDVPIIQDLSSLDSVLANWPKACPIYMADECGGASVRDAASKSAACAALIGPEGGFDAAERARLHQHPAITPVSLGPRILRAETAAIVLLSFLTQP